MPEFIMPLNMTVKHIMLLTDLGETTCREYLNDIKALNNIKKPHLVRPMLVCNYLNISYNEAYEKLKAHFDTDRNN